MKKTIKEKRTGRTKGFQQGIKRKEGRRDVLKISAKRKMSDERKKRA